MRPADIADRLQLLSHSLRLLDADLVRMQKPHLRGCQFFPESGVIVDTNGNHEPVPHYCTNPTQALTLPGARADIEYPMDIVADWLRRTI